MGAAGLCSSQDKVVTTFKCYLWQRLHTFTCYCTLHEGRKSYFHTRDFPEVLEGETTKHYEQKGNPQVGCALWFVE